MTKKKPKDKSTPKRDGSGNPNHGDTQARLNKGRGGCDQPTNKNVTKRKRKK